MQPSHESVRLPDAVAPYISVVATARNDDHGGNLLRRMQIFVDAWINQAKRHHLHSELILVEWNPPEDRERLAAALRWPSDTEPCQVRIVDVPPEIHVRYQYAGTLPLYQMIAKNVGIRRARGEFILVTNIDIVFSDELMQFLAARRLEKGRMYRIDRHDVMSDVPVDGTIDEQLAYCRSHVIRLCAREGVFQLTAEGLRRKEALDITSPESGIHFGGGWFPVERWESQEPFRWIGNEAEIQVRVPPGGAAMMLDVEGGPGVDPDHSAIEVLDWNGTKVTEWIVRGRSKLELVLPPAPNSRVQTFRLVVRGGGRPVLHDLRILNFRVFRCDWAGYNAEPGAPVSFLAAFRLARPTLMRLLSAWRQTRGLASLLFAAPSLSRRVVRLLGSRGQDIFEAGMEFRLAEGWHELEHSGGERFRWASQDARLVVRTPNDGANLALIIEPGPAVGFQPFVLSIRSPRGKVMAREQVNGMTYVEIPVPAPAGTISTLVFSVEGGGEPCGGDHRSLQFRVFVCGGGARRTTVAFDPAASQSWNGFTLASEPPGMEWGPITEKSRRQIAEMGTPTFLHTNACGDFTLMAKEHWHDMRGYAEVDIFSMHLDSLLCCAAHHAGIREQVLPEPMRIYHIEHGIGSGWTPEGQVHLYARLAQKGIQSVSYEDLAWSFGQMRSLHAPVIFNLDDWGLARTELSETVPGSVVYASGTGR